MNLIRTFMIFKIPGIRRFFGMSSIKWNFQPNYVGRKVLNANYLSDWHQSCLSNGTRKQVTL